MSSAAWLLDTARARMGGTCCSFSMSRAPDKRHRRVRVKEVVQIFGNSEYGFGKFEGSGSARVAVTATLPSYMSTLAVALATCQNIHNLLADELVKSVRALVQKP